MKVNVYCKNLGWLFEDLKREIASYGAIPSEAPLANADAWICIRDTEANLAPDKSRTVVTVHHIQPLKHRDYGMMSFVHPFPERQWRQKNPHGRAFMMPIGSRDIPVKPFPRIPTLGFFCREHGVGLKRSRLFADAVTIAKKEMDFNVLMIGEKLEHISYLGVYKRRAAVPGDYSAITAFCTTSISPMVPLSCYEALAAGRPVVSTTREFPFDVDNVFMADTAAGLASGFIELLSNPKLIPQAPFSRSDWCHRMVKEARNLCSQK